MNLPDAPQMTECNRRTFLTTALAGAAIGSVVPGVFLHVAQAAPRATPVNNQVRWGLLIDTNQCVDGCDACMNACAVENGLVLMTPPNQTPAQWAQQKPQWIRKVKLKENLSGRITNLPMLCQHCERPPCVDVCPTGASFRRADGIVLVDRHLCIGCRYCLMACPYHARSFIHSEVAEKYSRTPRGKGCVESCTFCVHRLDSGMTTIACQEACEQAGHHALLFGDLNDTQSALSQALRALPNRQIRADLELNTGVRYSGL